MKEGIHAVLRNPILVRIAGSTATSNLGTQVLFAVFTIYALDYLHFSPIELGLVGTIGAVGFVLGVLVSRKLTSRFGIGRILAFSIASPVLWVLSPLALYGFAFVILSGIYFVQGIMLPMYNINAVSLRQAITPDALQGRVNATNRTIVWGTIPIGSFVGGILGGAIGVVNTLYFGGVCCWACGTLDSLGAGLAIESNTKSAFLSSYFRFTAAMPKTITAKPASWIRSICSPKSTAELNKAITGTRNDKLDNHTAPRFSSSVIQIR